MKTHKKVILILSIILASALIWGAVLIPLPYYIESPGGASDIRYVLTVNGQEDQEEGSYNFVYVQVKQATAVQLLAASLDKHSDIYT